MANTSRLLSNDGRVRRLRTAKAVLDELCATQAPGFILAVYRPGDVERDAWCIAQYGEVDEFLDATALIGEQPASRR